MRKNFTARTVVNFIAYCALILISIAMTVIAIIKPGKVTNALSIVSQLLAYLVVILVSFCYAKSKRNTVFLIVWFLFAALLGVMFFIA